MNEKEKNNFNAGDKFWLGDDELAYAVEAKQDLDLEKLYAEYLSSPEWITIKFSSVHYWLFNNGYISEILGVRFSEKMAEYAKLLRKDKDE